MRLQGDSLSEKNRISNYNSTQNCMGLKINMVNTQYFQNNGPMPAFPVRAISIANETATNRPGVLENTLVNTERRDGICLQEK